MASTPCPMLEDYNSLLDPNLAQYFSSPVIKRHLRKIGLINRKGELRSETEIVQFNAEVKQKSQFNDLLSRAIILKAAELDRQRQHEMKKLQNEFEKKERVKKARDGKNKMDYTKILSAKFYTEGEDEDYIETDVHEEEVTLTFPIAISMPEGDQVYSMSKLMQQKKVMSPYIADGRPNTVGHHALPTLVHDRVQARIYGSGKNYQKRPTSNQSRASYTMGPKKSVTISSINRLARSKLPALEKPPKKSKKKSKKQQAEKAQESVDSGHESVKAESEKAKSEKAESEKAELIEELIKAENIEPAREVRSSTPTKSSSKSSRKSSSSSKKSKSSSKSSSRNSSRNSIKEDVQVRVESPSKASSEHEKSLSSSSHSSSRVSSAQSHHKKSSSEKSSLSKRPVLPSLSRGHSSSSSRSSKSVSSHGSENALPETVMHSRISRISVHDESIVTVDVSSESESDDASSIMAVDISSHSSQVGLPTEITSSVSKHPSTWDLPKSTIEVQPEISECVSITTKPSEVISLKSSTPNHQEFQVKIQPVHNNRPISGQSTKSTISVKSTVSSDLGFEAELLQEVIAEVEKSNNSRMNSRANTESVMKNGTSPSVNVVVENESFAKASVRSLVASVDSLNSSSSEEPENAEIVASFMDKSIAVSEKAVSKKDVSEEAVWEKAVSEKAVSEKAVSEKAISEKFNSSINFNDEVSEVASEKSISRSNSVTIVEDERYYEDDAESLCSRSSGVDLPVSMMEKSMMSKSRQSLISIPASRMSLVSGVTKASHAMIPDSASSSENEEEMMPARSTTETKASAYSLPMTPQTLKKGNSSLSSSMSSLTSSSSDSKSRSKSKASAMFA